MENWTAMYARTKQAFAFVASGDREQVVEQVTKAFPQYTLAFEAYTDQVDVFTVAANGKRRKLLTLTP